MLFISFKVSINVSFECHCYASWTDLLVSFGYDALKSQIKPIMRSISKENLKLDERLLTLKCNYNSLKISGALWDQFPSWHLLPTSHLSHAFATDSHSQEELIIMQQAWGYVPSSFTLQLLWKVTADLLVPKEVCKLSP